MTSRSLFSWDLFVNSLHPRGIDHKESFHFNMPLFLIMIIIIIIIIIIIYVLIGIMGYHLISFILNSKAYRTHSNFSQNDLFFESTSIL